jgi:hypothetical protein
MECSSASWQINNGQKIYRSVRLQADEDTLHYTSICFH